MDCRLMLLDMLVLVSLSLFLCPTVGAANITVEMGQTATLPCTGVTNDFREWQRLGDDGTETQLITLYKSGSTTDLQEKSGLDTFNLRGRFTATADDAFTATITNTRESDDGRYQCDSTSGSVVHMLLTYYMNSVSLSTPPTGSVTESIGGRFIVTCTADSKPAASFTWTKQGDSNFTATGARLEISNLNMNDSGTYMCTAFHAYASGTATVQLTVTEEPVTTPTSPQGQTVVTSAPITASKSTGTNGSNSAQTGGGLGTGGIVGIVIAFLALAAIGVVGFVLWKRKKGSVESGDDAVTYHSPGHPGAPENLSRPPPNEPEVMYAELDLKNAPAGSRRPYVATPDDSPTEYAQIRPDKPPRSSVPHTLAPDDKTEYASISKPKPSRRLDLQAV
ncbi:carcinoembryonic antigen-related cell adhesion molecule 1-like isoform X2 [Branchiostoma lanceolatum]|uniref:carcinoembryonic antigen-related cell adhesion molecule 1-like isoform X2 n=1 Tax=Branchiostoma lanceolatum TaxID=7740 RepID=UPI0034529552